MFNRENGQLNKKKYLAVFWGAKKPDPVKGPPKRDMWIAVRLLGKHFIRQKNIECTKLSKLSKERWENYHALVKNKASNAELKAALESIIIPLAELKNRSPYQEQMLKQAKASYEPIKHLAIVDKIIEQIRTVEWEIMQYQNKKLPINDLCYIIAVKNEEAAAIYNALGYHALERLSLHLALEYLTKSGINNKEDGLFEDITEALEKLNEKTNESQGPSASIR